MGLVGCSGSSSSNSLSTSTAANVTADPITSNATGAEASETIQEELVRFIAAVESVIEGSSYEGTVFETAEIYIAIAQGFCARLSSGAELDLIIDDYFVAAGLVIPDDDDLLFVGAILGAGIQTLCPEQADKL